MSLSLPEKLLKKHLNRIFIETGTHMGNGVQLALDCEFQDVYSIEKNSGFYNIAAERFKDHHNVMLYHGDSQECLPMILECIDEPVTFWLDAHIDPAEKDPKRQVPILGELAVIEGHPIKTHTILIDDRSQFGKHQDNFIRDAWSYVKETDVLAALSRINLDYHIYFEDNKFRKKQIIVATIKRKRRFSFGN
jgi:hypothetical protein